MLDQLRAMGVFACVVEKSSFSGAARELGITTSAVSQQIRSLENDMEVTLLHRSTRKLSLTETGQAFFHSCKEMLAAAERGKIRINELRDDLVGELRLATTPELAANHVIPALSQWISAHRGLAVHIEADNQYIDLIEGRIDIALRLSLKAEDASLQVFPLTRVEQVLVATPSYLNQSTPISRPEDFRNHDLIPVNLQKNAQSFTFQNINTAETISLDMDSRFTTNNVMVAKSLCLQGYGIARLTYLDVQNELRSGALVEVLPEWKLPAFTLNAVTSKHDQQPMKIHRCLDALKQYFGPLSTGRNFQEVS